MLQPGTRSLLLVEDEAIIALSEKRMLEGYGYRVSLAASGEAAVEIYRQGRTFDLILMDIDLGSGMDGTEAAALILAGHTVPVLFLSSHTEPEVVEKTEKITSYGYVVKNSSGTVLDASIKMAFKLFDANREAVEARTRLESTLTTLPKPLNDDSVAFEDLFDHGELQRIQDEFAAATGVASIITRPDGTPITGPSRFTELCWQLIRGTSEGCANCVASDAAMGRFNPGGPIVQKCLSGGLWDAGVSIMVGGRHVANWLIGQVRDETLTGRDIRAYARSIGADEDAAERALLAVPVMTRERFEQIAQALYTLATQLSLSAYQNVLQARMITRYERAEAELSEQKNLLAAIVESSSMAIFVKDKAGVYITINGSGARMLGYEPSEVTGKTDLEILPANTAEEFMRSDAIVMTGGKTITREESATIDGRSRVFRATKSPWRDAAGDVQGIIGISEDISIQTFAEKETKLNQARMKMLVDILQHPADSIQEFLDFALERAIALTGSRIGYIYHYDEEGREFILNTWSRDVMAECLVANPATRYALERTGIWGEAVRQRRPIVSNDFKAPDAMKKGLPAGHVALTKFMTVPVFVKDRIVGVVGLANKAEDYDQNDVMQVSLLMDVVWKGTERKKAEDRIKVLLEEKELLLREVHHRVKNNLHVILSLIALQAESVRDAAALAALRDTESRVRSMTVLYEKLYASSSFSAVSTTVYLPALVDEILENFPASASLDVEKRIDDFPLNIDKIQPLGILLNELLTNIMKYAFAGRSEGRIEVSAAASGATVTVVVADDGVGLPESIDFGRSPGFGLTLVRELANQLDGTIRLERGSGTRVILEFRG